MDEQTFMVRFESMRKPLTTQPAGGVVSGKGGRRQLLVTHAELSRQCRAEVKGYEYDSRMVEMQRRRDVKETEARQARLRAELWRLRREKPRLRATLEAEVRAHEQQDMRRANMQHEMLRRSGEERTLEVEDLLQIVESLQLPQSLKKNLEEPILAGNFHIKC